MTSKRTAIVLGGSGSVGAALLRETRARPLLSFVTPAKYKSITVEQIAKAMLATAKHHPATSATYHYPELMTLIASGQR